MVGTITQISDYVIFRIKSEEDGDLSALKHQKLLYYIQAWHLAFYGKRAFEGTFQAWIHGPVNREIYELYRDKKYLYSEMTLEDIINIDEITTINSELRIHIDTILDTYAKFSATQLELMTHDEDPWIEARKGYKSNQRCETIISDERMKEYYASRLS